MVVAFAVPLNSCLFPHLEVLTAFTISSHLPSPYCVEAVFADSRVRLTASQSSSKGQVGTALDVSLRLERWRALRGGLEKLSSQSSFYGDAVNVAQMEAAITVGAFAISMIATVSINPSLT